MDSRYVRHLEFFGAEGQARINATTVTVVGLGGLGCHVAQQLAYLGVARYRLVDDDRVSESNLNRLVGAVPGDVAAAKVDVAARLITTVLPRAEVATDARQFSSALAREPADQTNVFFGCVDDDVARLELLRYTSGMGIPYIDLATDIAPTGEFGGRVVFAKDGERCLSCLGELDQRALARAQMTDEQREADDEIYGINRAMLANGGPSVVSINGVVASLAVTEFMVWRTDLREPIGYLSYRGDQGMVRTRPDFERPYCAYCNSWGSMLE